MAELSNPDAIYSALKALSLLRANVGEVFKHLANAPQLNANLTESEQQQAKDDHIAELSSKVVHINNRFRYASTCTF